MPLAFVGAGLSALLAIVAAMGERRRARRANLDRVGVVDWRSVQVAALVATILLVSLGLHSR